MLDGELIVEDEKGGSSFSGLQSDLKGKRHNRMVYVVFDLLYCNGFDLMAATQLHRKAALHVILAGLPSNSAVRYSEHIDTSNEELLQNACRMGVEGIVSKRADARYVSGRIGHWIKTKCHMRQEFVIVGYVPSTALRSEMKCPLRVKLVVILCPLHIRFPDDSSQIVKLHNRTRWATGRPWAAAAPCQNSMGR